MFALYLTGTMLFAQGTRSPEATPVSNQVNTELPAWLRFSGEERARTEYIVGEGFKSVRDLYLLNRLRLNMTVTPLRWLKFTFQSEDSRVLGQNTLPAPASQKDAMDLRLGYVQIGGEERWQTLRVGRQSLEFGDGRLLADPNWSNVGKSFDAVRFTLRHAALKLDLFTGASVKVNQTDFDQPTPGEHFHGAYGTLGGLIPNSTIEPYLFWRLEHGWKNEKGKLGNLDEKTVGLRWAGKLPLGMDYTAEVAWQRGSAAGDQISAWMGHWVVGHTLADTRHRPRLFLEYNRASGDGTPKDGHYGTFDPLFPSSHDKYGLVDLFGSNNIVHIRPGFEYIVRPGLKLATAYDDLWLVSARDGLFVSNKIVARSTNGTAGTHIGHEVDIQALCSVFHMTQLNLGYGRLFAGEFLKHTLSGVPYNLVFLNIVRQF